MPRALLLDAADNVATALEPLRPGASVEFILKGAPFGSPVTVENEIPFGFKVSVKTIRKGDLIMKYGRPIGRAIADIAPGRIVHVENIEGCRGRGDRSAAQ